MNNYINSEEFKLRVNERKLTLQDQLGKQDMKWSTLKSKIFRLGFIQYDNYSEGLEGNVNNDKVTIIVNELNFNCDINGTEFTSDGQLHDGNVHFFIRLLSIYPDMESTHFRKDYLEYGTKKIKKQVIFRDGLKEEFIVSEIIILNKIYIFSAEYYARMFSGILEKLGKLVCNQEEFTNCQSNLPNLGKFSHQKRTIYQRNYPEETSTCMLIATLSAIKPISEEDNNDDKEDKDSNKEGNKEDKDILSFTPERKKVIVDYYINHLADMVKVGRYFIEKNEATSMDIILPNSRSEIYIYFTKKSSLHTINMDEQSEVKHTKQEHNISQLEMKFALNDDKFSEIRFLTGVKFDDIYSFLLECELEFSH